MSLQPGPCVETEEALGGYHPIEPAISGRAVAIAELCAAARGRVQARPVTVVE
jgi:hypothetical protein